MFRNHTLHNGLEIVAEVSPAAYSTAMGFFVKTGSRNETEPIAGVSHFLEHMMFKGTPKRSAADVNRELDEIGSHANAYTSEDRTVYYATFLPEYQERAVEILSDMLRPALREEDFNTEKNVIIEEICKYEDQPPFGAHEKAMAAFFGPHPLGHSILGTVESVTGLTPEAMRTYFESRYSPGNIVLAAAGRIDFDRLCQLADGYCGHWRRHNVAGDGPSPRPLSGFQLIHKEIATQEYVVQISSGPSVTDDDRHAMRLLATIVGDDSGSRLYWELIETGLAESAGIYPNEFAGTGIIMTFLACAPEDTSENMRRIRAIQEQVEAEGITGDELEQARAKVCASIVMRSERPSNRMFSVGGGWISRREYRTVKEAVEIYRAVTIDDVHRVLEKYPFTKNMTVAVGPLTELEP
jgi:predicted Zn-dependent peptidase